MSYSMNYNGINDKDLGVLVVKRPNIPTPEAKITQWNIAGRDGALFSNDGFYDDIIIYVELNFMTEKPEWNTRTRQIKEWLLNRRGNKRLLFSDDSSVFFKVKNVSIGEIQRTSDRIGVLTPMFTCEPYTYILAGQNQYDASAVERNPYMTSHPIYQITGEGMCTLTVNGNEMAANVGQNLTIDTDLMIAYRQDGTLQNTAITGDYEDLYLLPGDNVITITSGFDLKIIPNWRTL